MKKQFKWIWYAIWGVITLVGGGGTLFSWMPRTPGMFYGGCAMLAASVIVTTESVCPRFLPRELGLDMDVVD